MLDLSYWQSTVPTLPLSTELPSTIDVAVIGGGIIGASTCYWLAREGLSTALLERTSLAYGATGRNGGFVVVGPSMAYHNAIERFGHEQAKAILQLTCESQVILNQVLDEEEIDCGFREPGSLRLALTDSQLEDLADEAEALQNDGFPAVIFDQSSTQELIRTPISNEILGSQFLPNQGMVHSAALVQGLAQAAKRHGAQIYQAEVLNVTSNNGDVSLLTSRGTLHAKFVISAINAWTSKLFPDFVDLIMPIREQMLAYAPVDPVFNTSVSMAGATCEYWQQTPEGVILIGGGNSFAEKENMRTWDTQPTLAIQNAIQQVLPRLFPELSKLRVTHRWAGLLDYTTDGCPIIDQVPNMLGVFVIGGLSGHGMPFAMRVGQLMAGAVKRGTLPPDLNPYRLDRPSLKKWDL